jgi:hypothetical protein
MSDEKLKLTCPRKSFDALVEAVHKTKAGTETMRVKVADIEALLIDHGRLLRAVPHCEEN